MPPPISSGMSTVITTKLRARMRSMYSRRAISRVLRIEQTSALAFAADGLNEDLLQRRLAHLEPPHLRHLQGFSQQSLRIVAVLQPDLGVAVVVGLFRHRGMLQERVAA